MSGIILTIPGGGDSSSQIFADMNEPTGFVNRDDSEISFDAVTRTFTIAPRAPATEYEYYIKGMKYTITTSKNIVIPDTYGIYFIYLDDGETLQYTTTFTPETLIFNNAYAANIVWNDSPSANTNELIVFAEERHGIAMDGDTWSHFHLSFGTQYISGLDLLGVTVDPDTPIDTDAQFSVQDGIIRDEDLSHFIRDESSGALEVYDLVQNLSPTAQIPVMFKTGAGNWNITTANDFPFIYSDGSVFTGANGRMPYNEWTGAVWQLTESGNNTFVLMHYFATNDINNPFVAIQGIENYNDRSSARSRAREELNDLTGLPFEEYTPIATVILESRDTYTNTPKIRFRSTEEGDDYVDWRIVDTFRSTGGTSDECCNPPPRRETVPPITTQTVDSGTFNDCPIIKWMVSVHDTTTGGVRTMEVNAVHDFAGNVDFNCHSILGDAILVEVSAIAGAGSNEIELQVDNQSATNSMDVCAFRIIQ